MWKSKFNKKYFILFSLKIHNEHKNEELKKYIEEKYVCIMNMKNGVKSIVAFNKAQGMMNI
jgi:hypothetical protein